MITQPEVTKLIQNKSEHYDLTMAEIFIPGAYAFAHHFNCPLIGMSSADVYSMNYKILGNPSHPIVYPDVVSQAAGLTEIKSTGSLTFWNRLEMVALDLFEEFAYNYMVIPEQDRLLKKYFGNNFPDLIEIEKNMSLLYVNTDLVLQTRRPLLPNVIRMGGGLHINPPKPLPPKLQVFLDKATREVIYFSLGSNVKSKDLSEETIAVLLKSFSELPYQVLWKFEIDGIIESPKNVMTLKWIPQQDVLRHSNIVLFITQGGLQSSEEAIHSFVPMLVIPFAGDQQRNAKIIVEKGIGLALDHNKLTVDSLKTTILEVIRNPKYRQRVNKISQLIRDEPMTGLERALWWTEYVIRHKGALHLKANNELSFYQYYLLDVIGFCSAVVGTVIYIF